MIESFPPSLEHVLTWEGGYVNHPADPGGATNRGVTQNTYDAYRLGRGLARRSVRRITASEVADVYWRGYWMTVDACALPAGVDLCTFDAAVHSGPTQAVKWLQRALVVEADGIVGPVTLKAARTLDAEATINRMCDDRMRMLKRLKTWGTFGRGWTIRVEATRDAAVELGG
jgi:lysozyme family protein